MISIDALISSLPILAGSPFEITRLDGWSNHTYLLKRQNEAYVVRIPIQSNVPWLDRQHEATHLQAIRTLGITPPTVYDDPATGIAIRIYLPGTVISEDATRTTPAQLVGMATVLKRLHDSPCAFYPLSLFDFLSRDMEYVEQHFPESDARYAELKAYAAHIAQKWPDVKTTPCHMDPNPHNFLCTNDTVLLIDFEFAGQCDPAWDLAYTITYCNLSKTQEKIFLDAYSADDTLRERVKDYKPLTQWIQAIWIRQQLTLKHYPVPEDEMLRWEDRALERAITLMMP
jgi:thiamine kinase-like enzyme